MFTRNCGACYGCGDIGGGLGMCSCCEGTGKEEGQQIVLAMEPPTNYDEEILSGTVVSIKLIESGGALERLVINNSGIEVPGGYIRYDPSLGIVEFRMVCRQGDRFEFKVNLEGKDGVYLSNPLNYDDVARGFSGVVRCEHFSSNPQDFHDWSVVRKGKPTTGACRLKIRITPQTAADVAAEKAAAEKVAADKAAAEKAAAEKEAEAEEMRKKKEEQEKQKASEKEARGKAEEEARQKAEEQERQRAEEQKRKDMWAVAKWLADLGLAEHFKAFHLQKFNSLERIRDHMDDDDFEACGIIALADKKILHKALADLRASAKGKEEEDKSSATDAKEDGAEIVTKKPVYCRRNMRHNVEEMDLKVTTYVPLKDFVDAPPPGKLEPCSRYLKELCQKSMTEVRHVDESIHEVSCITSAKVKELDVKAMMDSKGISGGMIFAIVLYTFDLCIIDTECAREENFFFCLNTHLRKRMPDFLRAAHGYLYYLMTGLVKMTAPTDVKEVWRGVDAYGTDVVKDKYRLGQHIHWSGFSSSSPTSEAPRSFAGSEGVLLHITLLETDSRARDIRMLSAFPDEEEILLLPNFRMVVTKSATYDKDLMIHIVDLVEVIEAPPEVF